MPRECLHPLCVALTPKGLGLHPCEMECGVPWGLAAGASAGKIPCMAVLPKRLPPECAMRSSSTNILGIQNVVRGIPVQVKGFECVLAQSGKCCAEPGLGKGEEGASAW